MQTDKIIRQLEILVNFLENSENSIYAARSVWEIRAEICEICRNISTPHSMEKLQILLAPTGDLQEISIDNGWGEEFLRIASEIEILSGF